MGTRVQFNNGSAGGVFGFVDVPYSSSVTSGNLLIAYVDLIPQTGSPAVTDTQGNTWAAATTAAVSSSLGEMVQIFYAIAGSTGGNTVRLTATPGGSRIVLCIEEWSDPAGLSQDGSGASNTGAGTTPSVSVTTTVDNGIAVGFISTNGGAPSAGGAYTLGFSLAENWWQGSEYDTDSGVAGSKTIDFGGTPTWAVVGAAFKIASGAAPQNAYPIADVAAGSWQAVGPGYETVRNLLTYTESFDNAAWTKVHCTITADGAADPNGGSTADVLVEDGTNNEHFITRSDLTLTNDIDYTVSGYAKPNGRDWIFVVLNVQSGGAGSAYFNVATGAVGTTSGAVTASIVAGANGYYRWALTENAGHGIFGFRLDIASATGDGVNSFAGSGTNALDIWGVQLEQASSASAYQPILATTPPLAVTSTLYPASADGSTGTPDDTTYDYVLLPGSTAKLTLTALTDPNLSTGHIFSFRAYSPQSRSLQADIYFDGVLTKSTTVVLTASAALSTVTLSGAEADSIVDYTSGQVWLTGLAS